MSKSQLGICLLVTSVITWTVPVVIQVRSVVSKTYYRATHAVVRSILFQAATLPGIWAGLALCGFVTGDVSPFAIGVILSMLVGMYNAWILLIEILR